MKRKTPTENISCVVVALAVVVAAQGQTNSAGQEQMTRLPTVADSVHMNHLEVPKTGASAPATFSSDRKNFVVVTHQGNLDTNTNDYRLLLFRSSDVFRSPSPEVLLTFASSSNRPAISNVRWSSDNKTILFLGEKVGQKQQIYSLNVKTRELKQLTRHRTDILAFDATKDLRTVVYMASQPVTSTLDEISLARGLLVRGQYLLDLLSGHSSDKWFASPPELFLMRHGSDAAQIALQNKETLYPWFGVSISPDGRFAGLASLLYESPESWKEYRNPYNYHAAYPRYRVLDIHKRDVRSLIDAPTLGSEGGLAWSADGKSVVVGGTYLPLNIQDIPEREVRKSTEWAVEVDVGSGEFTKITQGRFSVLRWDSRTNTVFLKPLSDAGFSKGKSDGQHIAYQKTGAQWEKVDAAARAVPNDDFDVREEQDINTPPRLFVVEEKNEKESLLMDLNPQFRDIRFGHVEEIAWKGTDGIAARGGLYLPVEYKPNGKYPLVIQTHGWYPDKFEIDGFSTAGYAAQALAGRGFVVAQLPMAEELGTALEGPQNMAMFEGLIEELDRRGLINRTRVGLLGFSRTGYAVRYTLAFSRYCIAAAVVADGMDAGYWQYVVEKGDRLFEEQNGAPPFGEGLQTWLKKVPSFNLDRIHTPIRQLGFGPNWFEYNWESFVGLSRLGKPVEMIWLPDALHEPVKPLERMTAQQGDVDWFCFWLKGEEDPTPAKAEQYARWRQLRELQQQNEQK
jgi:dipeptidyl aminopeptidase/acylaminoacyl peptidase